MERPHPTLPFPRTPLPARAGLFSMFFAVGCETSPSAAKVAPTPTDTAMTAPIPAFTLPALEYEHPYRQHAEAATAAVAAKAGEHYQDAFKIDCEPKGDWCAIRSTQPDPSAALNATQALRTAIQRERPGLGVVLYSASDFRDFLQLRFLLARPGQLEQEPYVVVSETSQAFAQRVMRASKRYLPSYLAKNLHLDCMGDACGASVIERSEATFEKVIAATRRACVELQCEILVTEQEGNAAGMQRGRVSITRSLRMQ